MDDNDKKITIKNWLRGIDQNREWLAEQLGANKRTIDNWLSSSKQIPQRAWTTIEGLMDKHQSQYIKKDKITLNQFLIEPTREQFRGWNLAALKKQMLVEDWICETLDDEAKKQFPEE